MPPLILLPRLNHLDGLHVAGDYVNGYGHEDALKSGLHAACRVGIAAQAKALIHSDGFAPKLNTNQTLNQAAQFIFADRSDVEKIMEVVVADGEQSVLGRVSTLSDSYELLRKGISAEIK